MEFVGYGRDFFCYQPGTSTQGLCLLLGEGKNQSISSSTNIPWEVTLVEILQIQRALITRNIQGQGTWLWSSVRENEREPCGDEEGIANVSN